MDRCVEVRAPMKLSLGVVSSVGPGIGVLCGGGCAASIAVTPVASYVRDALGTTAEIVPYGRIRVTSDVSGMDGKA